MKEVEIEIQINSFKDEEKFSEETIVKRHGKEQKLVNKLFFEGDRYFVSKKRASDLVEKGIAKIVKEDKKESGE
ncbi:MAG TPA: hypothetical protein DCE23_04365 [Firmicutes bacterium]|nr:hypothetical protein [Bacillota bacterium]